MTEPDPELGTAGDFTGSTPRRSASSAAAASNSSGPQAAPIAYGSELLKYVAIGKLYRNPENGELQPEKHRLIAHNFGGPKDPDPEWGKQIKAHIKLIMKKASHKLLPGKRIRLKDEAGQYEVHI